VRDSGRDVGVIWARDYATPRELKDLTTGFPPNKLTAPHSVFRLFDEHPEQAESNFYGGKVVRFDVDRQPWWAGFRVGATEVWEAVQAILKADMQP
jgi:hypothetical protein